MLFDICIIDTDTPLYKHRTPEIVLESTAKEKRGYIRKQLKIAEVILDLVVSVDGLLHREANHFIKCIAASLAMKWEVFLLITRNRFNVLHVFSCLPVSFYSDKGSFPRKWT